MSNPPTCISPIRTGGILGHHIDRCIIATLTTPINSSKTIVTNCTWTCTCMDVTEKVGTMINRHTQKQWYATCKLRTLRVKNSFIQLPVHVHVKGRFRPMSAHLFLEFIWRLLAILYRQCLIALPLSLQHHLEALEGQLLQLTRGRDLDTKMINNIPTGRVCRCIV